MHKLQTFGTIKDFLLYRQKFSRLSGNFPDYQETFQTIRKLSRLPGNFPDHPETFRCNFKGYAQKLSGPARTFRARPQKLSGWQRHDATMVFVPLMGLSTKTGEWLESQTVDKSKLVRCKKKPKKCNGNIDNDDSRGVSTKSSISTYQYLRSSWTFESI